jgi:hypothetical protein
VEYNLCKEYPALTPIMIDDMPYFEVMDLYIQTREIQIEQEKELDRVKAQGEVRNYIPATTNDW